MKIRYRRCRLILSIPLLFILPALFVAIPALAQQSAATAPGAVAFESNRGQIVDLAGAARPEILFRARAGGMTLYLGHDRIGYVLSEPIDTSNRDRHSIDPFGTSRQTPVALRYFRVDMQIVGASPVARVETSGEEESRANYYPGGADEGLRDVRSYRKVIYHDIYPHIDLLLKGESSGIKYEFIVRPGGDPSRIRLRWIGATGIRKGSDGAVRITTPAGDIIDGAPVSLQHGDSGGTLQDTVATGFVLSGDDVGFAVGEYDRTRELVIDPAVTWATCYGGVDTEINSFTVGSPGVALGADGAIVSTGYCNGASYPTTPGAFQVALLGGSDAVVVKLRSNGTLAWATYFGGRGDDNGGAAIIDPSGNIYFTGSTNSLDFPTTTGVFQAATAGDYDAFLAKLDSTGGRVWASYFGGNVGSPGTELEFAL